MANEITFMTANFVARETGYGMRDWGHGDGTTQAAFAPVETFGERFDALVGEIRALGFDAIDLWSAHLSADWATDAHLDAARAALGRHDVSVASYATALSEGTVDRVCELASAIGAPVLTGPCRDGAAGFEPALERHGLRFGVENHPERTPEELLAKLVGCGDAVGVTVDTGWWGTHGYDAADAVEELADRLVHLHLKDVRAVGGHETCRWGEGVVPIEACVRAAERVGYDGPLSVEHVPSSFDPSAEVGAMRAELAGWLS